MNAHFPRTRSRTRQSAPETPAAPAERTRDVVQAEIVALLAERTAAAARIDELACSYDATLLTGDDTAADANEAERVRLAREVRRADLRLPALEQEAATAIEREEAAQTAQQQAEAEAAVQAVLSDLESGYSAPARQISAFLDRWQQAAELARAAGIEGPDRIRSRLIEPERFEETREEPYTVFLDEFGRETTEEFSRDHSGMLTRDARFRRQPIARTRTVVVTPRSPARYLVARPLLELVNLPGAALDDDAHAAAPGLARDNLARTAP